MAQITSEQKLEAVNRYKNGGESLNSIAKSLKISNTETIDFWIKKYHLHGAEAFRKSYTTLTLEDKLNILNYMNENGLSTLETAVQFNLSSPGVIRKWRISLRDSGVDALIPKKKGRPKVKKDDQKQSKNKALVEGSLEALQAENERLRMENAYLKKLNALVQEKEALQRKTKRK
jgi:transposase-like protein